MAKIVVLTLALMGLNACSNPVTDLKSPCAGAEDSPCDRRPVNDGWHPV